jgi:hypothetical protein
MMESEFQRFKPTSARTCTCTKIDLPRNRAFSIEWEQEHVLAGLMFFVNWHSHQLEGSSVLQCKKTMQSQVMLLILSNAAGFQLRDVNSLKTQSYLLRRPSSEQTLSLRGLDLTPHTSYSTHFSRLDAVRHQSSRDLDPWYWFLILEHAFGSWCTFGFGWKEGLG